jgi:hypothetical protein
MLTPGFLIITIISVLSALIIVMFAAEVILLIMVGIATEFVLQAITWFKRVCLTNHRHNGAMGA